MVAEGKGASQKDNGDSEEEAEEGEEECGRGQDGEGPRAHHRNHPRSLGASEVTRSSQDTTFKSREDTNLIHNSQELRT